MLDDILISHPSSMSPDLEISWRFYVMTHFVSEHNWSSINSIAHVIRLIERHMHIHTYTCMILVQTPHALLKGVYLTFFLCAKCEFHSNFFLCFFLAERKLCRMISH